MTAVSLPVGVPDTPEARAYRDALERAYQEAVAGGLDRAAALLISQHSGWRIAAGEWG